MVSITGITLLMLLFVSTGCASWIYTCMVLYHGFFPDLYALCFLSVGLVLLDVLRLKPAHSHTIMSLIIQYISNKAVNLVGKVAKWQFDRACWRCKETQTGVLTSILKQNMNTLFLKDHSLDQIRDVNNFTQTMPLTSYLDYAEYIDMIQTKGSPDVMFPGKPFFMGFTSGTTSGKSKAFPKFKSGRQIQHLIIMQWLVLNECGNHLLNKWFFVHVKPNTFKTESGIDAGPITAPIFRHLSKLPFNVTPATDISTEKEALYVNLLFGLNETDVSYFTTMSSTLALSIMTLLEDNWESICDDIELGKISEEINISANDRIKINQRLVKNPKRAETLRSIFRNGFKDVIQRVWPTCPGLLAMRTGVFEAAAKIVQNKYMSGVPCRTLLHTGTEAAYGINLYPLSQEVTFVSLVTGVFFEFIPEADIDKHAPNTLLTDQVRCGEYYEMVVTTFDGLYRYRTGDVVRVVGFHGSAPMYTFIGRSGDILSAYLEKVPEFIVHDSVDAAASQWQARVIEFTCTESIHVQNISDEVHGAKYYIVFMELEKEDTLQGHESQQVDEELCQRHTVYSAMRKNESLEQIKLVQVRAGTFQLVKELMMAANRNTFLMQFKLPKIVRREDVLKCLLDQTVKPVE